MTAYLPRMVTMEREPLLAARMPWSIMDETITGFRAGHAMALRLHCTTCKRVPMMRAHLLIRLAQSHPLPSSKEKAASSAILFKILFKTRRPAANLRHANRSSHQAERPRSDIERRRKFDLKAMERRCRPLLR